MHACGRHIVRGSQCANNPDGHLALTQIDIEV